MIVVGNVDIDKEKVDTEENDLESWDLKTSNKYNRAESFTIYHNYVDSDRDEGHTIYVSIYTFLGIFSAVV